MTVLMLSLQLVEVVSLSPQLVEVFNVPRIAYTEDNRISLAHREDADLKEEEEL